jgi:hypothetical protein
VAPAPPPVRDFWAWASLLAILPLVLHSLGAPFGEPVAEDFDFLHRAVIVRDWSLLDGGGSTAFWRPVSHQLYYIVFGPLMLDHPRLIGVVHALLMALSALLVYLALRRALPGPAAALAATFPLFSESTRTLLSWPSHFVDLGLWLFTAIALFEASRGRLWTCLVALLAALGCKELAVIAVLLVPWMPGTDARGGRRRWVIATGALAALWGAAYLAIRHRAHLELPHGVEHSAEIQAVPIVQRVQWAFLNSLRALFSLPLKPAPHEIELMVALTALTAVTVFVLILRRDALARLMPSRDGWQRSAGAWVAWGLAWFVLSSAALVAIYPMWQPNRSAFGALGLGAALAVLLAAAHPFLLAALFAIRLGMFVLSPGPPATVTAKAPDTGAFMDFDHLVRLQRLMEAARLRLHQDYPTLPHGARVVQLNMPRMAEYAFGRSYALEAWYRDSTVQWMRYDAFQRDTSAHPITVVQYAPDHVPMMALVDPRAMRLVDQAIVPISRHDWSGTLAMLNEADSLQKDRGAGNFFAILRGRQAMALAGLDRLKESEAAARSALAEWPGSPNARYWLGFSLAGQKRFAEAEDVLDSALVLAPNDTLVRDLRTVVRKQLANRPR